MADDGPAADTLTRLRRFFDVNKYGLLVCALIATAAQFLAEHYGAPAMLMALLIGIAFHFLTEDPRMASGIDLTAKKVLRFGVAILGARISADMLIGLGWQMVLLLVLAVAGTILFGVAVARLMGRSWHFGALSGGSVAICGASAAMAIAAVLPKDKDSERNLIFVVMGVTILSTIAMIFYPILTSLLAFTDLQSGTFLGGTIHDVAQVVGAGFSVSVPAGEMATLVKLIRVTMLAPVILVLSLVIRNQMSGEVSEAGRPPLLPFFVIAFLVLAAANTFGLVSEALGRLLAEISRWALLFAVAAVGMKTSLKSMLQVGGQAILLIVLETLFIGTIVLVGTIVIVR